MDQIQPHAHTMLLRHPGLLATAKAQLTSGDRPQSELKVLSFGCSIGDELASLKLFFPRARLFGCDIDAGMLDTARASAGHLAEIFVSAETELAARGPFDLICAFSSLCIHPPPAEPMGKVFSFSRFCAMTDVLDAQLVSGGVLALYNASYLFQRTPAFAAFTPLRSDLVCRNGFVDIHDQASDIIVEHATSPTGVSVRRLRQAGAIGDDELVDCLFVKAGRPSEPITVTIHDADWPGRMGYSETFSWRRSELDGFPVAERPRYLDLRRHYRAYADGRGENPLYEYDVCRTSLDGERELRLATYGPIPVRPGDAPWGA